MRAAISRMRAGLNGRSTFARAGRAAGFDPLARHALPVAAIVAAGLILLTCAHAVFRGGSSVAAASPREVAVSREAIIAGSAPCAVYQARFGGRRAQLIRVMRGRVANYVVMEVGKRDPAMRSLRTNWLKANYGDGDHVWLGEYASAESAMVSAAKLCPLAQRCGSGEADCGPKMPDATAAQVFFGLPLAPTTPDM